MREIHVQVFILEIFLIIIIKSSTVLTITLSIIFQLSTNVHYTKTDHLLNYQNHSPLMGIWNLMIHLLYWYVINTIPVYAYIEPLPIIVIVLVPIRYLYLLGDFLFSYLLTAAWTVLRINKSEIFTFLDLICTCTRSLKFSFTYWSQQQVLVVKALCNITKVII